MPKFSSLNTAFLEISVLALSAVITLAMLPATMFPGT